MVKRRTFASEAEIAAYKLGYNDAIDVATMTLRGTAAVAQATGVGGEGAVGALTGCAASLETNGKLAASTDSRGD